MPTLTFASSAAKCFTSDAAMDITAAVQLLGGCGYVRDYPVERMMMRDAKITQIYEHQPGPADGHGPAAPQGVKLGR